MTNIDLILSPGEFAGIASLLPGPHSLASPFAAAGAPGAALDSEQRSRLQEAGILGSELELSAAWLRTATVLASAQAATSVELHTGPSVLRYTSYFDPSGGPSVALTMLSDGLRVQDPAPAPELLGLLGEVIGTSSLPGAAFETRLEILQARVLAALIDERRRQVLLTLAVADQTDAWPAMDEAGIERALAAGAPPPFWLSGVIADVCHAQVPASQGEVAAALDALVQTGQIRADGRGFVVDGSARDLAERLLVVERVLTVTAVREHAGRLESVGFTCLQAGLHDLLAVEGLGETVHLEAVSAAMALDYVRLFLEEAEALAALQTDASAVAVDAVACGRCGASVAGGSRFCIACGAELPTQAGSQPPSADARNCPGCGAEASVDARFCMACGSGLASAA